MEFNLEQLRAFVATVDKGSFSAAARHLGKVQSAVSTAVANLEIDLGINLFDRSGREPKTTPEARALLPKIREILEQSYNLRGHANAIAGGEEGKLSLAIEESILSPQLDDLLCRFELKFPELELELLTPDRMKIIDMVQRGQVDIGLVIPPQQTARGYKTRPLGELMLLPVVGVNHLLAQSPEVTLEDLKRYKQLILVSHDGDISAAEKFSPKTWRVESVYWMVELIAKGIGWGWLPRHLAAEMLNNGSLVRLGVEDFSGGYHVAVDALFSYSYQQGDAGIWLEQQLIKLITEIEST